MGRRKKKITPVLISDESIWVNCYRIKVETVEDGLRIYCYNKKEIGDIQIIVEGRVNKFVINTESSSKTKEIIILPKINPSLRNEEQ